MNGHANSYLAEIDGVNSGNLNLVLRVSSYLKTRLGSDIAVAVLQMNAPIKTEKGKYKRSLKLETPENKILLNGERELRELAYRNTDIHCDDDFYLDVDMSGNYNLICVYIKNTYELLLSARYYYNRSDIKMELEGSNCVPKFIDTSNNTKITWVDRELSKYQDGEVFIVDRMSGNTKHNRWDDRDFVKMKFYECIFKKNLKAKRFYALARKGAQEKLLETYVRLGLKIIETSNYKGVEHWVLSGNWNSLLDHYKKNKEYLGIMNSIKRRKRWRYSLSQFL